MIRRAIVLALCVWCAAVSAGHAQQKGGVLQSGLVTPGHAPIWVTSGVIGDAGSALSGNLTELGITNTGTPFCINDAPITGQYHQFCLGANVNGAGGLLSYNAYGGAPALPLTCNINGVSQTCLVTPPPYLSAVNLNVKQPPCNAVGNGTADDTAAIQACINLVNGTGGAIAFPVGTYCVKTGPLTVTGQGVSFVGQNRQAATVLSTCGTDTAILAMSGYHDLAVDLQFIGSPRPGTTKDVIAMNSGCIECTLNQVRVTGGHYAAGAFNAYEIYCFDCAMDSTYGPAFFYLTGTGGYIQKSKFDQAYPYATPAAGSTTFPVPAWAGSTAYVAGKVVSTSGYILQATVGGTSGISPPAIPSHGATTNDGTVVWGLVNNVNSAGVQCDTACGFQLIIDNSDFSAALAFGITISNSLAGAAPHGVVIGPNNTFGGNLYDNINATAGFDLQVHDNAFGGVIANNGACISFAFIGDDNIVANNVLNCGGPASGETGLFLDANNTLVSGNICSATTCFSIGSGVTHFRILGNSCFSGFGASITCVSIASGASDFYTVAFNDAGGSTTSIFDGGSVGVPSPHKVLIDENSAQYGIYVPDHIKIPTPAAVIASGFGTSPSIMASDSAGRITVGTGGASAGVVTLGANYQTHFPNCVANDETSAIGTRVAATAANQLTFGTISGSWAAGDNLTFVCLGN